jgi:sortase A
VVLAVSDVVLTVSLLVILYGAWQLTVADAQSQSAQAREANALLSTWDREGGAGRRVDTRLHEPLPGSPFAVLRIPRFGESWRRPVLEGTTLGVINRGVGHYAGSAMPGDIGNFAVAGHRMTHGSVFKDVDEIRAGDQIVVDTSRTTWTYRVTSTFVVTPDRVDVVGPNPVDPQQPPHAALMTVTTCEPLYGSSQRYIVRAELVGSAPTRPFSS